MKHLERLFTPKNQDNSEKGCLVVSQTFDFNFLPFQGHKNQFSTRHFLFEISRSFQIRSQKRGTRLRRRYYVRLTLKIDLKVKIDGTVKCPPRSWSTFFPNHFFVDKVF